MTELIVTFFALLPHAARHNGVVKHDIPSVKQAPSVVESSSGISAGHKRKTKQVAVNVTPKPKTRG